MWAKIPEQWRQRMDTLSFAMKLLEEGDVAASPGSGFGPAGEGYLRMALVENEERLRQAVRQIGRCLGAEARSESRRAHGSACDGLAGRRVVSNGAQIARRLFDRALPAYNLRLTGNPCRTGQGAKKQRALARRGKDPH